MQLQLGDHLGFAGIVVALIGIALTIIWPTKRWVGVLCLVAAALLGIVWGEMTYQSSRHPTPSEPSAIGIDWSDPAPIIAGTPLSTTQLNARPSVEATPSYSPDFGAVLPVGTHLLTVTFAPKDTKAYSPASKTVSLVVNSAPLVPRRTRDREAGSQTSVEANPLDLADFNPHKGGSIYNKTGEPIFALGITTTVKMPEADDSVSIPLDLAISAHETKQFPIQMGGQWSTLVYQTADWPGEWSKAHADLKQCVRPFVFLPTGFELTQVTDHYRSEKQPLPVGDAEAKITYRERGVTREELLPMKALILVQDGCVPQ